MVHFVYSEKASRKLTHISLLSQFDVEIDRDAVHHPLMGAKNNLPNTLDEIFPSSKIRLALEGAVETSIGQSLINLRNLGICYQAKNLAVFLANSSNHIYK